MLNKSVYDKALQEVIDLHVLIENLFRGNVKDIKKAKTEFLEHFDKDFYMITPSGTILDLVKLSNWYPSSLNARPGNKIEIVNFKLHDFTNEYALVTYEEKQTFAEQFLHRISTALLIPSIKTVSGFVWKHLHETWVI